MQRDEVVIQDIINAAQLVVEFVKGFDKETFIVRLEDPFRRSLSIDGSG